jgi:hypothetical protein
MTIEWEQHPDLVGHGPQRIIQVAHGNRNVVLTIYVGGRPDGFIVSDPDTARAVASSLRRQAKDSERAEP